MYMNSEHTLALALTHILICAREKKGFAKYETNDQLVLTIYNSAALSNEWTLRANVIRAWKFYVKLDIHINIYLCLLVCVRYTAHIELLCDVSSTGYLSSDRYWAVRYHLSFSFYQLPLSLSYTCMHAVYLIASSFLCCCSVLWINKFQHTHAHTNSVWTPITHIIPNSKFLYTWYRMVYVWFWRAHMFRLQCRFMQFWLHFYNGKDRWRERMEEKENYIRRKSKERRVRERERGDVWITLVRPNSMLTQKYMKI